MKALKYSGVFKKVEQGARVLVAYDNSTGFALIATSGNAEIGLEYKGPNNRLFIKELRQAKHWTVRDEIDVVDFHLRQAAGFQIGDGQVQKVEPGVLKEAARYAALPVLSDTPDTLRSMLWLHKGALYGTDGHRMHRVVRALPSAPEELPQGLAIPPSFLQAFLAGVMLDKASMWAGVVYEPGGMRLVGGNEAVTVWLKIDTIPDEHSYQKLVDYFDEASANFADSASRGAIVVEQEKYVLSRAVEVAPRLGADGSRIGFRLYPDGTMRLASNDEVGVDDEIPPVDPIDVASGAEFIEKGDYIALLFSHKFLTQALSIEGPVTMLVQEMNYLWLGNPTHTCVLMPIRG